MNVSKVLLLHDKRKSKPWIVRYYGEFDPAKGTQRRHGKSFERKKDAERFRAKLLRQFDLVAPRDPPAEVTLGTFCKTYVRRRSHEWAAKTKEHISVITRRLISHFEANRKLSTITPEQAAAFWANSKSIRQDREGEEISRSTRNRILRDAKTMFRYARVWRYVESNPFDGLKQLRVSKRTRQDWLCISPEEYRSLLKVAPSLCWKVFYALAYTTGARFGELSA